VVDWQENAVRLSHGGLNHTLRAPQEDEAIEPFARDMILSFTVLEQATKGSPLCIYVFMHSKRGRSRRGDPYRNAARGEQIS